MNKKLVERYESYWNRENDTPIIQVLAPKDKRDFNSLPKMPENIKDRWTNIDYVLKKNRWEMQNNYLGLDAFNQFNPNFGPDILGAITGYIDIEFGENTSWASHRELDWNNVKIKLDKENKWFKNLISLTECACKDSQGEYIVGITDLHPGFDCLTALAGPENVCIDIFEYGEKLNELNWQINNLTKEVFNETFDLIQKYQQGITNWMGIYSKTKSYLTSCDFNCLVSKDVFNKFMLDEIIDEVNFFERSIYHLDGKDCLRHIDDILNIKKLIGVQWVPGAGQPPQREQLSILKKIQDAGKNVHIHIEPTDLKILLENLNPKGLMMVCNCDNETDAKDVEKLIKEYYKY